MSRKRSPHDFIFKEQLGHGSYSTVYKALDKARNNSGLPQHFYAIKVCSKKHIIRENKVKYVTIEKNTLNLLAQGNNPGIVKLYYTFHDQENLYFVLDYAPGGELLHLLQRYGTFDEVWSKHFMCQLVDVVEYIHSKGVIHRDLKPENVLLSKDGRLMVTDFGAASVVTTDGTSSDNPASKRAASFVGTAEYVSPELLLNNQCFFSSDIWALGCILYQFMQGSPPFRGENELQTFEKIVSLDYHWKLAVNPSVMDLVRHILVTDPHERLSISAIKQHRWFQDVDWANKDRIWLGIWQLPQQPRINSTVMNKQLHVISTPVRNIAITTKKKKPVKIANTTSSIVEWRKMLGLSNGNALPRKPVSAQQHPSQKKPQLALPLKITTPPPPSTMASKNMRPPIPNVCIPTTKPNTTVPTKQNKIPLNIKIPSQKQSDSSPPPIKLAHGLNSPDSILKQDLVLIFEIPYSKNVPTLSLRGYSSVDDALITSLVTNHQREIVAKSKPAVLTLDYQGDLTYEYNSTHTTMVSIADSDLSMYDYEFDETKNRGFLILEKYRDRLWFLSLPTAQYDIQYRKIHTQESWVGCFFKARQLIEDKSLMEKLARVSLDSNFPTPPSYESTGPSSAGTNITMATTTSNSTISTTKTAPSFTSQTKENKKRIDVKPPRSRLPTLPQSPVTSSSPVLSKPPPRNRSASRTPSSPKFSGKPLSPSIGRPITRPSSSPSLSRDSNMSQQELYKKYNVPANMLVSSSRYEVLDTLNRDGRSSNGSGRGNVASSGASAAFKSLQK